MWRYLRDPMCNLFHTIPAYDRQTHRPTHRDTHAQTHDDSVYRASNASHGKKRQKNNEIKSNLLNYMLAMNHFVSYD